MRQRSITALTAITAIGMFGSKSLGVVVNGQNWDNAYQASSGLYPDQGAPAFTDNGTGPATVSNGELTITTNPSNTTRYFQYLRGPAFETTTAAPAYLEFQATLNSLSPGFNYGSEFFVSGMGGGVDLILGGNTNPGNPGIYGYNANGDIFQYASVNVYQPHVYDVVLNSAMRTFNLSVDGTQVIANQALLSNVGTSDDIYFGDGSPSTVQGSASYAYVAFNSDDAPTPAPEPCSLGVLGISSLALLRRRRRAR